MEQTLLSELRELLIKYDGVITTTPERDGMVTLSIDSGDEEVYTHTDFDVVIDYSDYVDRDIT